MDKMYFELCPTNHNILLYIYFDWDITGMDIKTTYIYNDIYQLYGVIGIDVDINNIMIDVIGINIESRNISFGSISIHIC